MREIKISTVVKIVAALAVLIGTISSVTWIVSSIREVKGIGSAVTLLACVWGFAALFLMNYKLYCKYHMPEGQMEFRELFGRRITEPTQTDATLQSDSKTQSEELVARTEQFVSEPHKTIPDDPDDSDVLD